MGVVVPVICKPPNWGGLNWVHACSVPEITLSTLLYSLFYLQGLSQQNCCLLPLSILKEINSECSLEGQILKLRLQYFGHLVKREDSLEKTLMLGKCEGKRRRGR